MKARLKKSFKLRLLKMKQKSRKMKRMKKMKKKSCRHFQILFHLKKTLMGRMKKQRPSKKKMQDRVKSLILPPKMQKLKKAKPRNRQLWRKHK